MEIDNPNISVDNSYQSIIPGTNTLLDEREVTKGDKSREVNECWDDEVANSRLTNYGNDYII